MLLPVILGVQLLLITAGMSNENINGKDMKDNASDTIESLEPDRDGLKAMLQRYTEYNL